VVEQHFDDCGADFSGLPELPSENHFADYDHVGAMLSSSRGFTDSSCFLGSAQLPLTMFDGSYPDVDTFLASTHNRAGRYDDVCEIFGGQGNTSAILVRRGYYSGPNFEIVCNFDLTCAAQQRSLRRYLDECRPKVTLLHPPCTGLSGWSSLNAVTNREGWEKSRNLSVQLGKLAAQTAFIQSSSKRHWLVEQPRGSAMFRLPEWVKIDRHLRPAKVIFDQCMAGQIGRKTHLPIKKPTECWASSELLVEGLRKFQCDGSHQHANLGSKVSGVPTERAAEAATWPQGMCNAIAAGVIRLITSKNILPSG